jgi:ubiquitin-protein ligase
MIDMQRGLSKRVPKEIENAQSDIMRESGIYYWFNEADMTEGKAMIIGPADTPYAFCPLIFSFKLSDDYPFSPPAVQILTSDGATRFHPNLYVGGKVCLSILGTWNGPKWSAIMTISSVLSSIQSLLERNPITNEPGWEKYTLDQQPAKDYADFVHNRIVSLCFRDLSRWRRGQIHPLWKEFEDVLKERGEEWYQKLLADIRENAASDEKTYTGIPYSMGGTTDWRRLLEISEQPL